jgi:hypothetical protein
MKGSTAVATLAVALAIGAIGFGHETSPPGSGSGPVPESSGPVGGLTDLNAMTLSCPRAALNAAARKAKEMPSQGTYQFSYFSVISTSHHALYEVHFESNYEGEPDLKYCVSLSCQTGWDPAQGKPVVASCAEPGHAHTP